MNIFPFQLPYTEGSHLFSRYCLAHMAELNEKYGDGAWPATEKRFRWTSVHVIVASPTEVVFETFDELGTVEHKIEVAFDAQTLAGHISRFKVHRAEFELDKRLAAEKAAARRLALGLVYKELFGEDL